MTSGKSHRGFAVLTLLLSCLGCTSTQGEAPEARTSTPAVVADTPGNAFGKLADNKFNGPWTISQTRPGLGPVFGEGDKVKVKSVLDGATMTVEYVHPLCYVSGPYVIDSDDPLFKVRYRCRWENKDGSVAVQDFREEELEAVPVASQH